MPSSIDLLPKDLLIKTGPVDEADWNYKFVLRWIIPQRYRLAVKLLGNDRFHRMLEVGYGSGVFLPTLRRYCEKLYGIDIHDRPAEVQGQLKKYGVAAELRCESVEALTFDEGFFEAVVAMSSLEFAEDTQLALEQIRRVLKPGGLLIVVTPGDSRLADLGLRLLTGNRGSDCYGQRRERLRSAMPKLFVLERCLRFPQFFGRVFPLYFGFRLRRR